MNLPGYDAWKLADPRDTTAEEERMLEDVADGHAADLRDAIGAALSDCRCGLSLATIRRVVIDELNKLRPLGGEPEWQTKTPVPVPPLG